MNRFTVVILRSIGFVYFGSIAVIAALHFQACHRPPEKPMAATVVLTNEPAFSPFKPLPVDYRVIPGGMFWQLAVTDATLMTMRIGWGAPVDREVMAKDMPWFRTNIVNGVNQVTVRIGTPQWTNDIVIWTDAWEASRASKEEGKWKY